SDSEYDTADEHPDIYLEKIKDPHMNRISEAQKFSKGEVCDYYAFVPKGCHAEKKNDILKTKTSNLEKDLKENKKELVIEKQKKQIEAAELDAKYKTHYEFIGCLEELNGEIRDELQEISDKFEEQKKISEGLQKQIDLDKKPLPEIPQI
ncbi:4771_t:CDS:2, partial [Paraglomus occultum]